MRRSHHRVGIIGATSLMAVALLAPAGASADIEGDFAAQADAGQLLSVRDPGGEGTLTSSSGTHIGSQGG